MILTFILLLTLIILGLVVVFSVSTIGAGAIILFGDVIVCILVLAWLIKKLTKRR